jgi:hypothetical protein
MCRTHQTTSYPSGRDLLKGVEQVFLIRLARYLCKGNRHRLFRFNGYTKPYTYREAATELPRNTVSCLACKFNIMRKRLLLFPSVCIEFEYGFASGVLGVS